MKLRKLLIHNIASIADAEIDFDKGPLARAGIFLICGPTGAGKSTILDSIVLALYGDAPRFLRAPRSKQSAELPREVDIRPTDVRNILRHGTGEGRINLTFRGINGVEYLGELIIRRARNKPGGNLLPVIHRLTRLAGGEVFTKKKEVDSEISEAIGLDFDQFCRTVMLPQGEFTRFLNAKDDDKAALLEKITRVDIYTRIGAEVYRRHKQHRDAYELARRLADDTNALSPEDETAVRNQLDKATNEAAEADARLAALRRLAEKRERLAEDDRLIEEGRREAADARQASESDAMASDRLLIERLDCSVEARAALAAADKAAAEKSAATTKLMALSADIAAWRNETVRREQKLSDDRREIESLEKLTALAPEQLAAIRSGAAIKSTYALVVEYTELVAKTRDSLGRYRHEVEELEASLADLRAKREETGKEMIARRAAYEALKDAASTWASTARENLTAGCQCPVCRQKVEELPREDNKILKAMARDARVASETADKVAAEADQRYNKAEADIKSRRALIPSLEVTESTQGATLAAHRKALDDLLQPLKEAYSITPETDIAALGASLSHEEEEHNRRSLRLEKLRGDSKLKAQELTAIRDYLARIDSLPAEYFDPEATPSRHPEKIAHLASLTATLSAAVDISDTKMREESDKVDNWLSTPLGESFSCDELRRLGSYSTQAIARLRKTIAEAERRVATSRRILAERLHTLRAHRRIRIDGLYPEPSPEGAAALMGELQKILSGAREAIVEATASLKQSEENRRLRAEREAEASRLKVVADRWSSLNTLIGSAEGDKLRRIAQSLILSSLTDSANRYMATLAPRYRLRVAPGTFNILVEDAFLGYATRPASTVSGGESFLVSLALALALSDIGSTLSVDTLFIDEGFGSLSGDALEYALSTLADLRSRSNRRVGVISHVAELRDRIDTHIDVGPSGIAITE